MALPLSATEKFFWLYRSLRRHPIEFPNLKPMVLAQWAIESGWGSSALAREHNNFAGMKWREIDGPYGTPFLYDAHDGRTAYTSFDNADKFIQAYWNRLDNTDMYAGWRGHVTRPEDFISYIAAPWVAGRWPHEPHDRNTREYIAMIQTIYTMRTKSLDWRPET